MDKSGLKLNHFWTGINRGTSKSTCNQPANTAIETTFFDGSSDIIQTRIFTYLVVALFCIVSLNLALSFWIIHSLQIGNGGLGDGNLLATVKRMTVKGQAKFNGWLIAEEIQPVHRDQWVSIVGANGQLQLSGVDDEIQKDQSQKEATVFSMTNSVIDYQGPSLVVNKVTNGTRQIQFSIDPNQLTINSLKELRSTDWGLVVDDQLEASSIKGDHFHDLRLESRMKGLSMEAISSDLRLSARVGQIDFNSYKDFTLSSTKQIKIESSKILFKSLPRSKSATRYNHQEEPNPYRKETIAYQICTCENGRLFLTQGDKACCLSSEICSPHVDGNNNEAID